MANEIARIVVSLRDNASRDLDKTAPPCLPSPARIYPLLRATSTRTTSEKAVTSSLMPTPKPPGSYSSPPAPAGKLFEHFGFTVQRVADVISSLISQARRR